MNNNDVFRFTCDTINLSYEIVDSFRRQNLDKGIRKTNELTIGLLSILESIFSNTLFETIDSREVINVLKEIEQAQVEKDYILLADLIELNILPLLLQIQNTFIASNIVPSNDNIFSNNINCLSIKYEKLVALLSKYELDNKYVAEPTSCGEVTMAYNGSKEHFYFHSNSSPSNEGLIFANEYYDEDARCYLIYGLGLAYHIKGLRQLDPTVPIKIVESDINVILCALQNIDLMWLIEDKNIELIYDKNFTKLVESINSEINMRFIIHYPSIRLIENEEIKELLMSFFIRDSGIRNTKKLLISNARSNFANYDDYVTSLSSVFSKKG